MLEVNVIETKVDGLYILQDNGVNYMYDEKTNKMKKASNLELEHYMPRSKYAITDCEIDNWMAWK